MTEPPPFSAWFTPPQRRLLTFAISGAAWILLVWLVLQVFYVLQTFVATFGHIIWPLAIAAILSVLLRPLVKIFERRLRFNRLKAVILLYIVVVLACVALAAIVLPLIVNQLIELVRSTPDIIHNIRNYAANALAQYPKISGFLKENLDRDHVEQYLAPVGAHLQSWVAAAPAAVITAGATLRNLFGLAASIAVIPIYLFFLLDSDRDFMGDLRQQLTFVRAPLRHDLVFLVSEFVGILMTFFRGQLLIGLILGILKAIGFTLIGVQAGLLLGLIFGLLNVVPYLGTILGLCTVLPIAYFQTGGGLDLVMKAIGVFVVVQTCEGYFITPRIMGHRTGLHPMIIILSIFFWGEALNGILGMVLAVPLTAFLVVVWRLLRSKYLPQHGTGLTRMPHPLATRHQRPAAPT